MNRIYYGITFCQLHYRYLSPSFLMLISWLPSRHTVASIGPLIYQKEPLSYAEAIMCPDADVWQAAMDCKKQSLEEMGAFEEVELPSGERTIGLKWVSAYKMNSEGMNILEKAHAVTHGYSQHPGQFDETYAPVAKMASVCVLLTWAAIQDLDIY